MNYICRLCALTKTMAQLIDIHDPNHNLKTILERCCQLKILDNDKLPNFVCISCVNILSSFWKFYNLVHRSRQILLKTYSSNIKYFDKDLKQRSNSSLTISPIIVRKQVAAENQTEGHSLHYEIKDLNSYFVETEYDEAIDEENDKADFEEEPNPETENKWVDIIIGSDPEEEEIVDNTDVDDDRLSKNDELSNFESDQYRNDETIEYAEISDYENKSNKSKEFIVTEIIENATWENYIWKCFVCKENFETLPILLQHNSSFHKNKALTYLCVDCHKPYSKYNTFINHVKSVHRPNLKLVCDVCNSVFSNYESLSVHRSSICNDTNYPTVHLCTFCFKGFMTESALGLHSSIHISGNNRYKYECQECGKEFATKPNLKAHIKIHSGIKDFVCDFCGKRFVQKANLEEHLVTHETKSQYECEICKYKFKTPARLTKHKTVHTGVKPYSCEECGKKFRSRDTLRVHTRIHTGLYPYECETCLKRFRFRSILVTHRYQHTGVRPYSCEECQHHFTNWPNYNKHMKRRHGVDTSSEKRKIYNAVAAAAAAQVEGEASGKRLVVEEARTISIAEMSGEDDEITLYNEGIDVENDDKNEIEMYLVENDGEIDGIDC